MRKFLKAILLSLGFILISIFGISKAFAAAKALEMPNIEIRIKPSDSSIAFKNFLIDPPLLFLKSIFNFLSLIIRPPYNEITLEYKLLITKNQRLTIINLCMACI